MKCVIYKKKNISVYKIENVSLSYLKIKVEKFISR